MAYWTKTIGHWWEYVGTFLAVSIIGTTILGYFVAHNPDGLFGVSEHVASLPILLNFIAGAIIFYGPLFNVYTAIIAAKCAIEADDDYHWSLKTLTHLPLPSARSRRFLIAVLTFIPGLLLLPSTFWMYTAPMSWLWHPEAPVYAQRGAYVSLGLVLLVYVGVPKVFPSAVDKVFEWEDKVREPDPKE